MKAIRKDLNPLDIETLNKIREKRKKQYCGGNNKLFFEEIELLLESDEYVRSEEWEQKERNDMVVGNVWEQPIGIVCYPNTIHRYTYLWTDSLNEIIGYHNYRELSEDGKNVKKGRGWYIFEDGHMDFCGRTRMHRLFNETKGPIYVIELQIFNGGSNIH